MSKYKNIKIKKKGGGYRMQRVQVLASGKYKFVKNKGSSKPMASKKKSPKRKYTKSKTGRKTTMARRKRKGSRKQGFVSLALNGATLGIALAPLAMRAKNHLFAGDWEGFSQGVVQDYTGLTHDGDNIAWNPMTAKGLFAIGGAIVFKKGTSMIQKHVRIKL
jgi:hypothetical protein